MYARCISLLPPPERGRLAPNSRTPSRSKFYVSAPKLYSAPTQTRTHNGHASSPGDIERTLADDIAAIHSQIFRKFSLPSRRAACYAKLQMDSRSILSWPGTQDSVFWFEAVRYGAFWLKPSKSSGAASPADHAKAVDYIKSDRAGEFHGKPNGCSSCSGQVEHTPN